MILRISKFVVIICCLFKLNFSYSQIQTEDSLWVNRICSELGLRKIINKNLIVYDFESRIKPAFFSQIKNGAKVSDIIYKVIALDTNEFYFFTLKKSKINIDRSLGEIILIEFNTSISNTIIQKNNKSTHIYDKDIFWPGYPELKLADCGLLGVDTIKKQILFLSGYMFLDDFKNDFFKNDFSDKRKIEYFKIKYFNYLPYNINCTQEGIFFKSKVNQNEIERNYELRLTKKNNEYYEQLINK
jgi:hypothetical protein